MSTGLATATEPFTIALVDDYDVVLLGLARMFDDYRDTLVVTEIDANAPLNESIDIVLYDAFAQPESGHGHIGELVKNPRARHVVVYTWNFHPELIESARSQGVHGYLSKTLSGPDLVTALQAVHSGEIVVSDSPLRARSSEELDWPGKEEGITDRESEILALITQGKSNAEVAELTYLSPNTVKSHIRSIYRKIGADSRTQAVLWGVEHGFTPDHRRIERWITTADRPPHRSGFREAPPPRIRSSLTAKPSREDGRHVTGCPRRTLRTPPASPGPGRFRRLRVVGRSSRPARAAATAGPEVRAGLADLWERKAEQYRGFEHLAPVATPSAVTPAALGPDAVDSCGYNLTSSSGPFTSLFVTWTVPDLHWDADPFGINTIHTFVGLGFLDVHTTLSVNAAQTVTATCQPRESPTSACPCGPATRSAHPSV